MSGKKPGGMSVDDVRDDIHNSRRDLSDTMAALSEKSSGRARAGWLAAAAGLLAGAAAVGTLRRRKARKTPKSRAQRAWRQMKTQVRKTADRVR
jgi:hypothetical protein